MSKVPGWNRTEFSNFLFYKGAEGREGKIGLPGPPGIGEPGLPVSQWSKLTFSSVAHLTSHYV